MDAKAFSAANDAGGRWWTTPVVGGGERRRWAVADGERRVWRRSRYGSVGGGAVFSVMLNALQQR